MKSSSAANILICQMILIKKQEKSSHRERVVRTNRLTRSSNNLSHASLILSPPSSTRLHSSIILVTS